jgi:hypothetical protein
MVNWKDWLSQVSSGVAVLVLWEIAASIWPPLKQWTLGHQNVLYIFLALIVGISIGHFSKGRFSNTLLKTPTASVPKSNAFRLDRVANLFWLGSDLQWVRQMADRGRQDQVAHGLKQAYHHSSELGLSATSAGQQLCDHKASVEKMPPQLSDSEKRLVVGQIDSDLGAFGNLMKQYQPDFRPGP